MYPIVIITSNSHTHTHSVNIYMHSWAGAPNMGVATPLNFGGGGLNTCQTP